MHVGARSRRREAGYNLVVLVVMITVLNILIAKALPLWSAVIQREKEEELIFRGLQYAEAIRVYEKRTGGLPTKLEQLIEVEPRSIRQLWRNPMAEDGSWLLIPPGQGGQRLKGQNLEQEQEQNQDRDQDRPTLPGDPSQPDPSLLWVPGGENELGTVPIFGVKSSVGGKAMKVFVINPNTPGGGDGNDYSDWLFTAELAKALGIHNPNPTHPIVPSMNAGQRFKPWPPGVRPINVPPVGNQRGNQRGGAQPGGGQRGGAQPGGGQRGTQRGGRSALERPGQRNQPGGRGGG